MPSHIATSAAALAPNPASTSEDGHTDRAWVSDAGRSSAVTPGCWRTSAWHSAMTASASSCSPCSRPLAYSWLQESLLGNSETASNTCRPAVHPRSQHIKGPVHPLRIVGVQSSSRRGMPSPAPFTISQSRRRSASNREGFEAGRQGKARSLKENYRYLSPLSSARVEEVPKVVA